MGFFDSIGGLIATSFVTVGLDTPLSRALAFGTVGFAYQYLLRPSVSYVKVDTKSGSQCVAKQFALFSSKESSVPTTYIPWYFWPLILAIIGGLFL